MNVDSRSKVTNDINYKENCALFAPHGQVRARCIAINWVLSRRFDKKVEYCAGRTQDIAGGIRSKCKDEDYNDKHEGMDLKL